MCLFSFLLIESIGGYLDDLTSARRFSLYMLGVLCVEKFFLRILQRDRRILKVNFKLILFGTKRKKVFSYFLKKSTFLRNLLLSALFMHISFFICYIFSLIFRKILCSCSDTVSAYFKRRRNCLQEIIRNVRGDNRLFISV